MFKSSSLRVWVIVALGLWAIYTSVPTFYYFFQPREIRNDQEAFQKAVPGIFPKSHVKLGLDIQGGVQLVLGIDNASAIDNHLAKMAVEAKRWSDETPISSVTQVVSSAYNLKNQQRLVLTLNLQNLDFSTFLDAFKEEFPGLNVVKRDADKVEFAYSEDNIRRIRESSLEQAERVIRSRVDKWGVAEPLINRRQNGSILVQLPGFSNPEKAKELLGRTAQLQFKIVDDNFDGFSGITAESIPDGIVDAEASGSQRSFVGEDRGQLEEFLASYVPEDRTLLFEREQLAGNKSRWSSIVVQAATEMTGSDIIDALVVMGGEMTAQPQVSLRFSALGGRRFAEITEVNIGKRMAIVLDDVVESAPVIQTKISGGEASITLGAGRSYDEIYDEANELALILKSGSVPATISILEERQVGSTLGPELASRGIKGILLGLVCVLFFMFLYYRRPGFLACVVLTLNGILLLASMGLFGFALTLPGIAGFILTLGMAVDANVLINERIRQELAHSKNARKSIDVAFKKVFWTIIDANITTLIACMILLETNSSGPIRGFAITLMMGLIISLFTSLYVTRVFFTIITAKQNDATIRKWFNAKKARTPWNLSFLSLAKPYSVVAALVCVVALGMSSVKGLNWGVDFAGGTEMVVGFSSAVKAGDIREVTDDAQLSNVTIQGMGTDSKQYLIRYENPQEETSGEVTSSGQFISFKSGLMERLASYNPEILQIDFVGPQVGQELRTQGLLSVIYAIIGILLYIALRFDIRFGSGAIIKMLVDVLLVLGFYAFFQRTFDLTSVAAFLTVLGYSVNDTIVIYDRIRENILNFPKKPLAEIIHVSLNETFTRTLNTSITTLIALAGILILSSGQLWTFAMAIAIGVVVATASSTLIASSFLLAYDHIKEWRQSKEKRPLKVSS
ncbi:MAG: protein translocase subunit SecD [Proteobacteria bacterium]|nr:protein translocase subunit SecD [Pseudomonadota bacterium]